MKQNQIDGIRYGWAHQNIRRNQISSPRNNSFRAIVIPPPSGRNVQIRKNSWSMSQDKMFERKQFQNGYNQQGRSNKLVDKPNSKKLDINLNIHINNHDTPQANIQSFNPQAFNNNNYNQPQLWHSRSNPKHSSPRQLKSYSPHTKLQSNNFTLFQPQKIYCIICNNQYSLQQRQQHKNIHARNTIGSQVKQKFTRNPKKLNQNNNQFVVQTIVQPNQCIINYTENKYIFIQNEPQKVQQNKNIQNRAQSKNVVQNIEQSIIKVDFNDEQEIESISGLKDRKISNYSSKRNMKKQFIKDLHEKIVENSRNSNNQQHSKYQIPKKDHIKEQLAVSQNNNQEQQSYERQRIQLSSSDHESSLYRLDTSNYKYQSVVPRRFYPSSEHSSPKNSNIQPIKQSKIHIKQSLQQSDNGHINKHNQKELRKIKQDTPRFNDSRVKNEQQQSMKSSKKRSIASVKNSVNNSNQSSQHKNGYIDHQISSSAYNKPKSNSSRKRNSRRNQELGYKTEQNESQCEKPKSIEQLQLSQNHLNSNMFKKPVNNQVDVKWTHSVNYPGQQDKVKDPFNAVRSSASNHSMSNSVSNRSLSNRKKRLPKALISKWD